MRVVFLPSTRTTDKCEPVGLLPRQRGVPGPHQERALEREAIRVPGSRQPVQEALHGVELAPAHRKTIIALAIEVSEAVRGVVIKGATDVDKCRIHDPIGQQGLCWIPDARGSSGSPQQLRRRRPTTSGQM